MGALVSVVILEKSELSPELLARIAPIWEADEATCTYRRATRTRERAACGPASGDERRGPGGPEPGTHRATAGDYGRSRIPGHFGNLMEDRCGDEVELLAQVAGSSGGGPERSVSGTVRPAGGRSPGRRVDAGRAGSALNARA